MLLIIIQKLIYLLKIKCILRLRIIDDVIDIDYTFDWEILLIITNILLYGGLFNIQNIVQLYGLHKFNLFCDNWYNDN